MADGKGLMMNLMIFGCGYSGKAIADAFQSRGFSVAGTARTPDKAAGLAARGVRGLAFDGSAISEDLAGQLREATHLVQSIPPGPAGDPLLKLLGQDIRSWCPRLRWVGYLSTVGVYGDQGGGWATEETETSPTEGRSLERITAEQAWSTQVAAADLPVAILRLSGIYGPGRNAFVNLDRGTARRIVKKNQVFNRIRVEDIGAATLFLAERAFGGLYNVTDDEPAPPQDVIVEAARLMGVTPPPEQDFETAEMTPMARSFYGSNKRVSNAKIRSLGFLFRFPDYRMSLAEMWSSGTWRG